MIWIILSLVTGLSGLMLFWFDEEGRRGIKEKLVWVPFFLGAIVVIAVFVVGISMGTGDANRDWFRELANTPIRK